MRRRVRNSIAIVYREGTARDREATLPANSMVFCRPSERKNDPGGVYFMVFDRDSYKPPDPKQSYLDFLKIIKGKESRFGDQSLL